MTSTMSPSTFVRGRRARPGRPNALERTARSSSPSGSVAARAAELAVCGRRAPGIATTTGERSSSHASATSAGVAPSRSAIPTSASCRESRVALRGPPRGEWAITAIPSSAHRSTIPPRSALSSNGLSATCTAAIGAIPSASFNWPRLTFESPTARTRPSSRSRASARTEVLHGVRGSGAWTRYRSIARPSSAARLASQSVRMAFARPSGIHPPPARVIPPFVTIRARDLEPGRRRARATSLSLCPSSASPWPYARAVSNTVTRASTAAAIVSRASSSSRSCSVDRRMQPRPMRSSEAASQSGRLRTRRVRHVLLPVW